MDIKSKTLTPSLPSGFSPLAPSRRCADIPEMEQLDIDADRKTGSPGSYKSSPNSMRGSPGSLRGSPRGHSSPSGNSPGSRTPRPIHHGLSVSLILSEIDPKRGCNAVFVDYLRRATRRSQYLVGDMHCPDVQIVACSEAWCQRCGFGAEGVLGRDCRHIQGPKTDIRAIGALSRAIAGGTYATTSLVNYHKDGTPFRNDFIMCPLLASDGEPRYYVSVHEPDPPLQWNLAAVPSPTNVQRHLLTKCAEPRADSSRDVSAPAPPEPPRP
mmetsp:Transcript_509/g.1473  ORF Transcript_509/g.1473 Transcript_509/m.1473 type:complete len:269 (-) Transcript_509:54-860(-)